MQWPVYKSAHVHDIPHFLLNFYISVDEKNFINKANNSIFIANFTTKIDILAQKQPRFVHFATHISKNQNQNTL